MRILISILALILVCGTATFANGVGATGAGAGPATQPSVTTQEEVEVTTTPAPAPVQAGVGAGDQMANACVMSCYNLTSSQLSSLRSQGLTNSDIAMAAAISAQANIPIDQVVTEWKNSSKNWNTVASNNNLSMANLSAMPVVADMNEESFNRTFFSQYYNIPMSDVVALRQQGWSWGAINVMANAAARTNQPITQIAMLRSQGTSWNDIATRYNVASTDFLTPVQMRTVTAMTMRPVIVGAGPAVAPVMYDNRGNVLLTQDQALRLYRSGYDWLDVAIAANITRETGVPIDTVLMQLRSGNTWEGIASDYGVPADVALNVADYPFPRVSIYSESKQAANMERIQKYQKPSGMVYGTTVTPSGMVCPGTCPPGTYTQPVGAGTGTICPSGTAQQPCPPAPVCPPVTTQPVQTTPPVQPAQPVMTPPCPTD